MALTPLNLQGDDGAPGAAATVTVGTVTTGNAGTSASVTNAGTSSAAVLNFTIPRGSTGAAGANSLPGTGSTANLATGNTTPSAIQIPEADANYTFTIDNATYTTSSDFVIRFPKPSTLTDRHWLRVTYKPKDRIRRISHFAAVATSSALSGQTYAPCIDRGLIVEPNPEPGSVCTIDYEWDVDRAGWSVAHWAGDVHIRRHEPLYTRFGSEYGLPVYMSPELYQRSFIAGSPWYGEERADAYADALQAIPIATRRLLGARGVWVDLCGWEIAEGASTRNFVAASVSGISGVYSKSLYSAAAASDDYNSSQLRGWKMQHELGHAMDQHWPTAAGWTFPNGTASGFYGTAGTLADDLGLLTLWNQIVTDHSGSLEGRFITSAEEWIAQVFMLCWAPRISGYAASSAWTTARTACTGPDTADWDAVVAYLQTAGAVPTPLV